MSSHAIARAHAQVEWVLDGRADTESDRSVSNY